MLTAVSATGRPGKLLGLSHKAMDLSSCWPFAADAGQGTERQTGMKEVVPSNVL